MKLWDLINPSDAVTFKAPDLQIALFVTVAISNGQYGAQEITDNEHEGLKVPLFLFGGVEAINEFCQENWNLDWEQVEATVIADRSDELCTAFDSFIYGNLGDRKLIEELLAALPDDEARKARLAEWNEERRSSMNNIVARADSLCKAVRKIRAEEERKVAQA